MRRPEAYPHLLQPQSLGGHRVVQRVSGNRIAQWLSTAAKRVKESELANPARIGVLIDARRKSPGVDGTDWKVSSVIVENIKRSIASIIAQDYDSRQRKIVVLIDKLLDVSQEDIAYFNSHNADQTAVSPAFNHAEGLNTGVTALRRFGRVSVVALLNAGAHYATDQAFRTMALAKQRQTSAIFGSQLVDERALLYESLWARYQVKPDIHGFYKEIDLCYFGFLPASGTAFTTNRLRPDEPFNRNYGNEGASQALLNELRDAHEGVVYHPAVSVQSAEGLGFLALARKLAAQQAFHEANTYSPAFRLTS